MNDTTAKVGPDPVELARKLAELAEKGQAALSESIKAAAQDDGFQLPDPDALQSAFVQVMQRWMSDPFRAAEAQIDLWRDYTNLWINIGRRMRGEEVKPVIEPAKDDRRFTDKAWNEEVAYDFVKQAYLLGTQWLIQQVRSTDVDPATRRKGEFYARQFVDALAPTNFVALNPQVMRETLESNGENLVRGLENMIADIHRGRGRLKVSMTDSDQFELGKNVATSPGKVVFQNDLMQLIQYEPTTPTVYRRPLLIVPPWINKFYILDLQPRNSFIRWAVEQGLTVFVVSWVNPDHRLAQKTFEDYMVEGPLAALDAIEQATGERQANVIGYCIGGTLMAATLAYMAATGDDRFVSATFFTALTDFKEAGELKVFIDEEQLKRLEAHISEKGYLEGRHMANVFNMMRDNDLIWSFVVNNYLRGRKPMAFDLLYWNADATRMPAQMHNFYLRNMYLENRLVEAGGITMRDVPIDLRRVALPVYQLSTESDHIAPWKATYAASQLYRGPYRFVLSGSGHIAGVVNPPSARKYCFWTNPENPPTPEQWFAGAARHEGSWWPDWADWIANHAGDKVQARKPGDGRLAVIEEAPGSYVKVRSLD
ncbi:PHA/PHB synthase family protein [Desertibaculum subflavum]|uniref:PHA/PHB synthase family protein n=1 Tax=Desertibaculum subflavum TaxID=2268458 RepID=UPI000E66C075